MRPKTHTLFRHLAQFAQTKNLKAAGVGKQRPIPAHELMQPAKPSHQFMPRPQIKMIGVAQNDLRAQLFGTKILKNILRTSFHRGCRSYRHECRCFDVAMRSRDARQSGWPGVRLNTEGKSHLNMLQNERNKRSPMPAAPALPMNEPQLLKTAR